MDRPHESVDVHTLFSSEPGDILDRLLASADGDDDEPDDESEDDEDDDESDEDEEEVAALDLAYRNLSLFQKLNFLAKGSNPFALNSRN